MLHRLSAAPTLHRLSSRAAPTLRGLATVSSRGGKIIAARGSAARGDDGGLHLPPAEGAVGPVTVEPFGEVDSYKKAVYCSLTMVLRTSTHVGTDDDGKIVRGKVGADVTQAEAKALARNSGLRLLSTIEAAVGGDMDRVEQVLNLTGLVNATEDFNAHGAVINGCSEVLIEAFGPDKGVGARTCMGVASLAGAVSCTLELRVRPVMDL